MRTVLLLVAVCSVALLVGFRELPSAETAQHSPNIIYIMADDLGYGDLSCYNPGKPGQRPFQTPNLDRMAREAIRFTDFYAGSTVCAPSRCALMTGKHMGHAYIRGNGEIPLRDEDITLAEFMKQRGYRTGMFGKWGLGVADNSGSPEKQGWDEFLGYAHHVHAHHFFTNYLWTIRDGKTIKYPTDSLRHSHLYIMDAALNFVKQNRNNPFFLYLPVTMPHAEVFAPTPDDTAPFVTADGRSRFPETPFVQTSGNYRSQPQPKANFAGMVTHLDRDVGRLLTLLRELGIADNTLVMFTSDNGPHQEGGADPEFFDSNGPLRGIKRDLYEGGIRVPFIVWGKGLAAGRTIREPLANWDIFPTIADLLGASKALPPELDGLSFASLLRGAKTLRKPHEYLYWEFYERGFDQAVRVGNWKAVRQSRLGSQIELFDLSTDLGETTNVAAQHPNVVAKAARLMEAARVQSELWPLKKL